MSPLVAGQSCHRKVMIVNVGAGPIDKIENPQRRELKCFVFQRGSDKAEKAESCNSSSRDHHKAGVDQAIGRERLK